MYNVERKRSLKKNVIIMSSLLLVVIIICITFLSIQQKQVFSAKKENQGYEQYREKILYGTEVITLINKAMNENEQNKVQKDQKGNYIENDMNSILIEIEMITDEEEQKTTMYRMETINKVGISEFITNFNTAEFKIKQIDYHTKTGKIKKIIIEQQ